MNSLAHDLVTGGEGRGRGREGDRRMEDRKQDGKGRRNGWRRERGKDFIHPTNNSWICPWPQRLIMR